MFLDVATILASMKVRVTEISARDLPDDRCITVATFDVKNVEELNAVRQKIRGLSGVTDVRRGKN